MKIFTRSLLAVVALTTLLFGCRPDNVGPKDESKDHGIAGAAGDYHPTLDTICKYSDTVFFRSLDGSYRVNKCGWDWYASTPEPCVDPQENWGYLQMYNGYLTPQNGPISHWLDVSFSLAYGWYVDFSQWHFEVANGIIIDPNTNYPTLTGQDWSSQFFFPDLRSEWKIQIPVDSLPKPCFDLAARLLITTIDINGNGSQDFGTVVWAINRNWNVVGSGEESNNEFAIRYCPFGCLENQCSTATNTVCKTVYTGLTCTNTLNQTTLTADPSGATTPIYNWSNGQHTQSITVNPTSNTTYTVSVIDGACTKRITTYNVNVVNLACQVPDHRADFCPASLDVRYGETFNIRNYVRMKDNLPVNWNEVFFTYTTVGANMPTNPANWKLASFNAGLPVTVSSADAVTGTGNVARGEYRVYVYRLGQTTYDDYMTIRVHPTRASNVNTAQCVGGACGYVPGVRICNVPPGQPGNPTSECVPYTNLSQYNISGLCGSTVNAPNSGYLGICGANPCGNNN